MSPEYSWQIKGNFANLKDAISFNTALQLSLPRLSTNAVEVKPLNHLEAIEELSEKGVAAFKYAQEETKGFFIGTEHLLLGLIKADSEIRKVFREQGITSTQIRAQVKKTEKGKQFRHADTKGDLTPRAKYAIELGMVRALEAEKTRIDTKDLVLGIISQDESTAAKILLKIGFDFQKFTQQIELLK